MSQKKNSDPVSLGYRVGGVFFGLLGLSLVGFSWYVRDGGWIVITILLASGFGMLVPSLGMLFAKTNEHARRSAAWLLLDLWFPIK